MLLQQKSNAHKNSKRLVNIYKHLQIMNSFYFRLGTAKTWTNN